MKVTFIGIGNTLAGDDGAGMVMLRKLRENIGDVNGVAFLEIPGDLFEIWDIASGTDSIVFLDAVAGTVAGVVSREKTLPRALILSIIITTIFYVLVAISVVVGLVVPTPPATHHLIRHTPIQLF